MKNANVSRGLLLGFLLIEFMFLLFAGGLLSLAISRPLSALLWPAALGVTLLTVPIFCLSGVCDRSRAIDLVLAFLAVLLAAVLLAAGFYDISWDGQTYHQEAILQLSAGWNPFDTELSDLYSVPMVALEAAINGYPKAPWITSAAFNLFFGDVETGKAGIWLLALAAGVIAYAWLNVEMELSPAISALLSMAMVLNPVAVSQSLSFYIDGHLYYLLVIVMICLGYALRASRQSALIYLLFLMAVSLALNTKVPAIAFIGMFMVGFGLLAIGLLLRGNSRLIRPLVIFSASSLFGLLVMGFHPYVTNAIDKGNPLYPVLGADKVITVKTSRPDDFSGLNQFEKFYRSLFAVSDNPPFTEQRVSSLKIPFSIDWPKEGKTFEGSDVRTGGFGPLFSGTLLLAIGLGLIIAIAQGRGRQLLPWLAVGLVIALSSMIHPEAWWLRYVPQFYLLPLILAVFLAGLPGMISRSAALLVGGLLIANGLLAAAFYYPHVAKSTAEINEQLERMASREVNDLNFLEFRSNRARLQQRGIGYTELWASRGFQCPQMEYFPASRTFICVGRKALMPTGSVACASQDMLRIWKALPAERRRDLQSAGVCIELSGHAPVGIENRVGEYVQIRLGLTDGGTKLLWAWSRQLPDPTVRSGR